MTEFLTMPTPRTSVLATLLTPWRKMPSILLVYTGAALLGGIGFAAVQNVRAHNAPVTSASPVPAVQAHPSSVLDEPSAKGTALISSLSPDMLDKVTASWKVSVKSKDDEIERLLELNRRQGDEIATLNSAVKVMSADAEADKAFDAPGSAGGQAAAAAPAQVTVNVGDLNKVYMVLKKSGLSDKSHPITLTLPKQELVPEIEKALGTKSK